MMAYGHDWILVLQSASLVWIFTLLLSESESKKTHAYFMDSSDCGGQKNVGGAVVFSHSKGDYYPHDIDCQMTFKAESSDWRLMLRVIDLDIPDRTPNGYCNDALYVFDDNTILTRAMEDAGGTGGLCGRILPPTLISTGQFMTVVFKTDSDGPVGRGFKFIMTAIRADLENFGSCGSSFQCENKLCLDVALTCDGVDNCGDYSDEAAAGRAKCKEECGVLCKFLTLGVTAAIFISVGSIVILLSCLLAVVCCCRRWLCRKPQDLSAYGPGLTTATTTVAANGTVVIGGGSGASSDITGIYQGSRAPSAFSNHAYTHQGYYPMQPVYPAPPGSVYSYTKDMFIALPGSALSQPLQHRSQTPTSSRSGKSNRSNNSTSVTYSQGTEKVSLPVNL